MNTDVKFWLLRNHRLLTTLSSEKILDLCHLVSFRTAKKGEIIAFGNCENQRIYFLANGMVKIVKNDENCTETIKEVLKSGDLFGQITLSNMDEDEYAVVMSDYFICGSVSIEAFEKILSQNPLMALMFTKEVGRRLRSVENRYENLVKNDVPTRFSLFLKDWVGKEGEINESKAIFLHNYLTHQDIASLICTTRQTVTQLFTKLREDKVLDYNRKHIYIYNLERLSVC